MSLGSVAIGQENDLYVSPTGSDANPGTATAPFATLVKARDTIRAKRRTGELIGKPVVVNIGAGIYRITETLTLTAEDSGTEAAPVTWRAEPGEDVRFMGGVRLTGFAPVSDSAVLARLPQKARKHVVQVNLRDDGIRDLGEVVPQSARRADLFFDHAYMTLARYPNEGDWARIANVGRYASLVQLFRGLRETGRKVASDEWDELANQVWTLVRDAIAEAAEEGLSREDVHERRKRFETRLDRLTEKDWQQEEARQFTKRLEGYRDALLSFEAPFFYSGDRPERWQNTDEVWVYGYWIYNWAQSYHQLQGIDRAKKAVWPKLPFHWRGYKKGQRFYFFNILEELDEPGEWYLDRETGLLYLWPPGPIDRAEITFPQLQKPMLVLKNVSYVSVQGITFECSRTKAIVVEGGTRNEVAGCVVRNVGDVAIEISGGTHHVVRSCDIYEVAGTGIALEGGGRKTLARGDHVVENCHIHHFGQVFRTYRPAVNLAGVGHRVAHCYIHDSPHEGIRYTGNDHVIEYCEFTRIALETGDVGVIATAMDWTSAGHVFRHNYFHHIYGVGHHRCFTIYPDLPCGGIHLYGNVFYDVARVFHTNSGRGMLIENNIFLRCHNGLRFNVWKDMTSFRGPGWGGMVENLAKVQYDKPPYSTRYPMLARLAQDFAKGEEHFLERAIPKDNVVRRNVSWGENFLTVITPAGLQHVKVEQNLICDPVVFKGSPTGDGEGKTYRNDNEEIQAILAKSGNIILDGDPGIVDADGGDFRLKADSPAHKLGFKPIPFQKIGLYVDKFRCTIPLTDRVRHAPAEKVDPQGPNPS